MLLVDAMDGMILVDLTHRTRFAELTPGEHVHAVGLLRREPDPESGGSAYRGASGLGWVLRPDPVDGLLLSSEPLDARFRRRARAEGWVALVASVALAFFGAVEAEYLARAFFGVDVAGTVDSVKMTPGDGDTATKYDLLVRVTGEEASPVWLSASEDTARVAVKGSTIPVRLVRPWRGASAIGPGARSNGATFVAGMVFYLVIYIISALTRQSTRAWYDGAKVVDTSSGRLQENAGSTSS